MESSDESTPATPFGFQLPGHINCEELHNAQLHHCSAIHRPWRKEWRTSPQSPIPSLLAESVGGWSPSYSEPHGQQSVYFCFIFASGIKPWDIYNEWIIRKGQWPTYMSMHAINEKWFVQDKFKLNINRFEDEADDRGSANMKSLHMWPRVFGSHPAQRTRGDSFWQKRGRFLTSRDARSTSR